MDILDVGDDFLLGRWRVTESIRPGSLAVGAICEFQSSGEMIVSREKVLTKSLFRLLKSQRQIVFEYRFGEDQKLSLQIVSDNKIVLISADSMHDVLIRVVGDEDMCDRLN